MTKDHPGVKAAANPAVVSGLEDRLYTAAEVAELFEVKVGQVLHWIRSNQLYGMREPKVKGYRISRESLVNFAMKRYQS